jgi:hypothetical protein
MAASRATKTPAAEKPPPPLKIDGAELLALLEAEGILVSEVGQRLWVRYASDRFKPVSASVLAMVLHHGEFIRQVHRTRRDRAAGPPGKPCWTCGAWDGWHWWQSGSIGEWRCSCRSESPERSTEAPKLSFYRHPQFAELQAAIRASLARQSGPDQTA